MKLRKWEAALISAVILSAVLGSAAVAQEQNALSDKLIRLHVVANSDTDGDQTLKLAVRDAVLQKLSPMLENVRDRAEAVEIIEDNIGTLARCASDTVRDRGCDYPVSVRVKQESFPTREYDTFSLPAGEYMSLRVTIGSGEGQNWWCVVFPPVCDNALTQESAAAINITPDELSLITMDSEGYVVKFRLMELLNSLRLGIDALKARLG